MRISFIVLFFVFSQLCLSQQGERIKLKNGSWLSELKLNNVDVLPFNLSVSDGFFEIHNGTEDIQMNPPLVNGDTVTVKFPYFDSELVFSIVNRGFIKGYWANHNKGDDYRIPFEARASKENRFSFIKKRRPSVSVDGRWEVEFEPNSLNSYPSVGLFEQAPDCNLVQGTFLTETGDYRFLEGAANMDSLFLSCFDGSHAFLFKASVQDSSMTGRFLSGKHWECKWIASRNDNYKISSPDELTFLVDTDSLRFNVKSLGGSPYNYPNPGLKNKVVIVQIMGTWCPNCLDEVLYYKELHDKYHSDGLEIVSVCYEAGKEFNDYVTNINRLKNKLNLDFTFLVGGAANKNLASEHFKSLNQIISFPTSVFIGRDGAVKRVHTGFNGPGTGVYYEEYVKSTDLLIQSLLKN